MSEIGPNMNLYVTTFNEKLYDASGKALIESFLKHQGDHLLVCTEGGFFEKLNRDLQAFEQEAAERIHIENINGDAFLEEWTEKHKKYIPLKYGGVESPNLIVNLSRMEMRNENTMMFRSNTARWFRKIVSLKRGLDVLKVWNEVNEKKGSQERFDKITFLDCDILFKKHLPPDYVSYVCSNYDFIYHLGKNRAMRDSGIESGFIIFNLAGRGEVFLKRVFDCYMNSHFLTYKRWDDGYIFGKMVKQYGDFRYLDVVKDHREERGGHVVVHGAFGGYIDHFKGRHKEIV